MNDDQIDSSVPMMTDPSLDSQEHVAAAEEELMEVEVTPAVHTCAVPDNYYADSKGKHYPPGEVPLVSDTSSDEDSYSRFRSTSSIHRKGKSDEARAGCCGLQNLGNTCFFNSAVQCLSHTPELAAYFATGAYTNHINRENKLGTGGKLADAWAKLMKRIWSGSRSSTSPAQVRKAICEKVEIFRDYGQHDSQEALGYLLDYLHEDVNKVKDKPATTEPDGDAPGEDSVLAMEAWQRHLSRNDSEVIDLFFGQMRSKVSCDKCSKLFRTFSPCSSFSIPVQTKQAENKQLWAEVYFYPLSRDSGPVVYYIHLSSTSRFTDAVQVMSEITGVPADRLTMQDLYSEKFHAIYPENEPWESHGKALENQYANTRLADLHCLEVFDTPPPIVLPYQSRSKDNKEKKFERILLTVTFRADTFSTQVPNPVILPVNADASYQDICAALAKSIPNSLSPLFVETAEDTLEEDWLVKHLVDKPESWSISRYGAAKGDEYYSHSQEKPCLAKANLPALCTKNDTNVVHTSLKINAYRSVIRPERKFDSATKEALEAHRTSIQNSSANSELVQLSELLKRFSDSVKLDENNKFYCPSCKSHETAVQELKISRLPKIMVIHLKRFEASLSRMSRLNTLVDFPITGLDMSPYLMEGYTPSFNPIYDLYAVSHHSGSISFGHYTASALHANRGKWQRLDDTHVNDCEPPKKGDHSAYILFYKLRSSNLSHDDN